MVYQNILEAVGNTPMVELNRMTGPEDARVLVKWHEHWRFYQNEDSPEDDRRG